MSHNFAVGGHYLGEYSSFAIMFKVCLGSVHMTQDFPAKHGIIVTRPKVFTPPVYGLSDVAAWFKCHKNILGQKKKSIYTKSHICVWVNNALVLLF